MAGDVSARRWVRALRRVALVEWRSPSLSGRVRPVPLRHSGRKAWAAQTDTGSLPPGVRPEPTDGHPVRAAVRADAVVIGKFDVAREVRLRSFYTEPGLTVRFQAGGRPNGVSRTVLAHRAVTPHDPGLMPALEDHGRARPTRGVYLVERTLPGRAVRKDELLDLVEQLATRLHRVHQGVGVERRPLSRAVSPHLPDRWGAFADTQALSAGLRTRVAALLDRDDLLEVSFGHGDLVRSNMLLHDGTLRLIDWEYSGEQPIAFDLAKVHLNCPDPQAGFDSLIRGLGTVGSGPGGYSLAEQIALGHVQALSWDQARRQRAEAAGRLPQLQRRTQQRIEAISALLD